MIIYPTDVSGCFLWTYAGVLDGILNHGDSVGTLYDMSGSGNHFTQLTSGNMPILIKNELNNESILRFNGNKFMGTLNSPSFNVSEFTIFSVIKPTGTSSDYTILSNDFQGGSFYNMNYQLNVSPPSGWKFVSGFTSSTTNNYNAVSLINEWNIRTDRSSSSDSSVSVYRNGMFLGSGSQPTPIYTLSTLHLGYKIAAGVGNYYIGDVAEIIGYGRPLSNDEKDDVEEYLKWKYFIGASTIPMCITGTAGSGVSSMTTLYTSGPNEVSSTMTLFTFAAEQSSGLVPMTTWGGYCETAYDEIIDNEDSRYSEYGEGWENSDTNWINSPYSTTARIFGGASTGTGVASWRFGNITPGYYDVFTHWNANHDRTLNAKYLIYDGSSLKGTAENIDQTSPPYGNYASGSHWYRLGLFNFTGPDVFVYLTGQKSDYGERVMVSDATRIVGYNCRPTTNTTLFIQGDTSAWPDDSKTLYIKGSVHPMYSGGLNLSITSTLLSGMISTMPFYIYSAQTASITMFVKTDETLPINKSITLFTNSPTITTNTLPMTLYNTVAQDSKFMRLVVRGEGEVDGAHVLRNSITLFMDRPTSNVFTMFINGSAGANSGVNMYTAGTYYSQSQTTLLTRGEACSQIDYIVDDSSIYYNEIDGVWQDSTVNTYYGTKARLTPSATGVASFTFLDLSSGEYEVFAHWNTNFNRTTNANYIITDGLYTLGIVTGINQISPPMGELSDGYNWYSLGVYNTENRIDVYISGNMNGSTYLSADAIRLQPRTCGKILEMPMYIVGPETFGDGITMSISGTPEVEDNIILYTAGF